MTKECGFDKSHGSILQVALCWGATSRSVPYLRGQLALMANEGGNPSTNPIQSSPVRRLPRTCWGTSRGEFATLPAILRTSFILSMIDPILLSFPTRGMSSISALGRVSARDGELSHVAREDEPRSIRPKTNGFSVWSPVLTPVRLT